MSSVVMESVVSAVYEALKQMQRERDEARRERDDLASRLADAEHAIHRELVQCAESVSSALDERNVARSERDEWHRRHQESCADRDRLQARISRIMSSDDICGEVGRPCPKCKDSYGRSLQELRDVLRVFYKDCTCTSPEIKEADRKAFHLLEVDKW